MASTKRLLSLLLIGTTALMASACCIFSGNTKGEAPKAPQAVVDLGDDHYTVLLLEPTAMMNDFGFETGRYDGALAEHAAYMARIKALPNPVNLVVGGTFFKGAGAMYIFKGTLPGEVWQISAKDPMVLSGQFKPTVRDWWTPLSTMDKEADADALYFVSFGATGKNWQKGKSRDRQPGLDEHIQYLSGLMADGSVALGGPFTDELGGAMTIYRAGTVEDFDKMVANDPWTKQGMYNDRNFWWLASLN